jgi:prophage antirepressor-like protein
MRLIKFSIESINEELPAIQLDSGGFVFSAQETCVFAQLSSRVNASKWVRNNIPSKWIIELKTSEGNGRPGLYLTKAGFYYAVSQGKSEIAIKFRDWVFEDLLLKLESQGYYIAQTDADTLARLQSELTHLQSQLETEQAKTLYMANFIDDGLQQAKTQAKIDWQCESSDVKGDPVVFAKAMIQERDEIAAKLRQYKDFGKAMHFFLSEAHPKILEEAATVWDVPKLPE